MKIIILISSVFLICFAGCKEREQIIRERVITITEDRNYVICGVTDPIDNIPWLSDTIAVFIDRAEKDYDFLIYGDHFHSANISLYKHKTEEIHLIGISSSSYSQLDCCCECGPVTFIYTCSKEFFAAGGNLSVPKPYFEDYYEWVTTLWHIEVVYGINEK